MKKKRIVSMGLIVALGMALGVGANVNEKNQEQNFDEKYSEVLADTDADDMNYNATYDEKGDVEEIVENLGEDEVCKVGENIVITNAEVEQYEEYFELNGAANPQQEAINYAEERNALYVAAIENGFDVTDEEVYAYLEELKALLKQEENAGMYQDAISGFESEEDYWEYEFEVYKVDLPIQKYTASLEEQYQSENGIQDPLEFEQVWSEEFEEIKEDLVEEQEFVSVDEMD